MSTLRRFLFVIFYGFWQGGFLFYTSVVVPIGTEVLGSTTAQGFITRLVTVQMNHSGAVSLVIWLPILVWETAGQRLWRGLLLVTWLLMALIQAGLYALHARLDSMIDVAQQSVSEPVLFYSLHRIYLWAVTVQWALALLTLLALVWLWTNPRVANTEGAKPA